MKLPQKCPYCKKDLADPSAKHLRKKDRELFSLASIVRVPRSKEVIVACPFCRKVISVS